MLAVEGRTREAVREFESGEAISAKGTAGRPDPYRVLARYLIGWAQCRGGDHAAALARANEIADLVRTNGLNRPLLDYGEFLRAEVAAARKDAKSLGGALDRVSASPPQLASLLAPCGDPVGAQR